MWPLKIVKKRGSSKIKLCYVPYYVYLRESRHDTVRPVTLGKQSTPADLHNVVAHFDDIYSWVTDLPPWIFSGFTAAPIERNQKLPNIICRWN